MRENSGLIDLDALMREAARRAPTDPPRAPDSLEALTTPVPAASSPTTASTGATAKSTPASKSKIPRSRVEEPTDEPDVLHSHDSHDSGQPTSRTRTLNPKMMTVVAIGALILVGGWWARTRPGSPVPPPPVVQASQPSAATPLPQDNIAPANADKQLRADDLPSAPQITGSITRPAPAPARSASPPQSAATVAVVDVAPTAPNAAGSLGDAMHDAVGHRNEAPLEASGATSTHANQLRPSQGAVVGALGSVVPVARACLGPDAAARNGLVVFTSDGKVARVDLNGTSAEDACVRAALSKARVAPFLEDTYAARVTVRP